MSGYLRQKLDFWKRKSEANWGYFFEKLHSLLVSRETLLTALKLLQEDKTMPQRFISKAITNLKNGLFIGALWNETSIPLNEGQKHLLQSAEQGGFFMQGVKQIKTVLRFQSTSKQQIRRGLVYPTCVLGVMVVFMFVLSLFLLQNVETFFMEQNIEPGAFTKFVFSANHYFVSLFFCFLLMFGVVLIVLKVKNISLLDKFELLIEKRCQWLQYSLFSLNLAEFLENNFPMLESVRMSLENFVDKITQNNVLLMLNNGKTLSESLSFMPKDFYLTLQNGEISGEVVSVLKQLSQIYYQRYEEKLSQWTKFVEPLCLVAMAVFVFLLIMVVFSPLLQLFQSINFD